MVFNSLDFLIFLPIVLLVYFILPKKIRYMWLLISSYYFYMCWNAKYALLMLFSTVVTYISGLVLEKAKCLSINSKQKVLCKKTIVAVCFAVNLGILFYFKYFNFAVDTLRHLFAMIHVELNVPAVDVLLPVGISFYTFQALGYTVDVYRDEIYAEKNFFRYALFVSFFPQLVAGPIERSKNLLVQLSKPVKFDFDNVKEGILLMIWGFFLKIVLADRIAIFVDTVYGDYITYGGWYLIIATILFAFQVYCDFYGYTVIARGTGMFFGVKLMENFDAPYLATSVAEFWRRWHISLTSWFKDYLYIPLGGSRKGKIRKYINKLLVFLVSGLWHGADISYVIWGMLNGIYQVVEEITLPMKERISKTLKINRNSVVSKVLQGLGTFMLIDITWIFFRADGFRESLEIIKQMVTVRNNEILINGTLYECGLNQKNFMFMLICVLVLFLADFCKYKKIEIRNIILKQNGICQIFVISGSILMILLLGIYGLAHDAANFIYFQF